MFIASLLSNVRFYKPIFRNIYGRRNALLLIYLSVDSLALVRAEVNFLQNGIMHDFKEVGSLLDKLQSPNTTWATAGSLPHSG